MERALACAQWTWLILLVLAAFALGLMGRAGSQAAWAAATGLILLVALFLYPKAGAGVALLALLLSGTLQTITDSAEVGYLDDAMVLACLATFSARRLYERGSIRWLPALLPFALYLAFGFAGSIVHGASLSVSAISGFLFVKGMLLALAVAQIDWVREDVPRMARFGGWLLALLLLAVVANAASPAAWNAVVGRQNVDYRIGIPSLTGIFDHPVGLGTIMSLSFLAVFLYRQVVHRSAITAVLLIGSALATLMSFRRKSIFVMLGTAVISRLALPKPRSALLAVLVLAVPLAALLVRGPLTALLEATSDEYLSNTETTARTIMSRDSLQIALAYLPLGAGLGRFGSFAASENYSPEYLARGYQHINGMGPGPMAGFLSDTFWPALLGESGFLGMASYAVGLFLLVRVPWRLMRTSDVPHVQWIGAVGVAWLVELTFESAVAAVFVSPPMYGTFFIVAGICASLASNEQLMDETDGWTRKTGGGRDGGFRA